VVLRTQTFHNSSLHTIHLLIDLRCQLLNNSSHHINLNTNSSRIPLNLLLINNISLINLMYSSSSSNHHRISQCKVNIHQFMISNLILNNILRQAPIHYHHIQSRTPLPSNPPTQIPWLLSLLSPAQFSNSLHQ
jgi:hypothetical protein